jgi:Protein of unknown function (DUF2808)
MKFIIYTTAIFVALASSVTIAHATGTFGVKVPHLSDSSANPSNSRIPFADYYVGIHVSGYSLSQITVDLPQDFIVSKNIIVRNKAGQKIEAAVSVEGGKAKFVFVQPVEPETMLKLVFKSVRTSTLVSQVWLLPVSGQRADTKIEVPLGTARIHTYD